MKKANNNRRSRNSITAHTNKISATNSNTTPKYQQEEEYIKDDDDHGNVQQPLQKEIQCKDNDFQMTSTTRGGGAGGGTAASVSSSSSTAITQERKVLIRRRNAQQQQQNQQNQQNYHHQNGLAGAGIDESYSSSATDYETDSIEDIDHHNNHSMFGSCNSRNDTSIYDDSGDEEQFTTNKSSSTNIHHTLQQKKQQQQQSHSFLKFGIFRTNSSSSSKKNQNNNKNTATSTMIRQHPSSLISPLIPSKHITSSSLGGKVSSSPLELPLLTVPANNDKKKKSGRLSSKTLSNYDIFDINTHRSGTTTDSSSTDNDTLTTLSTGKTYSNISKSSMINRSDNCTTGSNNDNNGTTTGTTPGGGGTGTSSIIVSIFNLINNVAGAGMLTLPYSQANGTSTGWIPSFCIACILGIISATTFYRIGYSCSLLNEYTFKGLWSRSIGSNTTYIIDIIIFSLCCAVCTVYLGILGDVFTPLIEQFDIVPTDYNNRSSNILLLSILLLLPLSLMKNLSALKYTSMLGIASVLYTTLFIVYRSMDGSYTVGSGKFVTPTIDKDITDNTDYNTLFIDTRIMTTILSPFVSIENTTNITNTATATGDTIISDQRQQSIKGDYNTIMMDPTAMSVPIAIPTFNNVSYFHVNFKTLLMISNFALAYNAHYNSPIFYRELYQPTTKKFGIVVYTSYILLIILYILTMFAGYKTFGDTCRGNILLNYHPNDTLSTIARLATGCSILFGFPLVMTGARESLINLLSSTTTTIIPKCTTTTTIPKQEEDEQNPLVKGKHLANTNEIDDLCTIKKQHSSSNDKITLNDSQRTILVIVLLGCITCIAITVQDVSVVVGLAGATLGSAIVYICPTLVYTKTMAIIYGTNSNEYNSALYSSVILIPFGIGIASFGVHMSLTKL